MLIVLFIVVFCVFVIVVVLVILCSFNCAGCCVLDVMLASWWVWLLLVWLFAVMVNCDWLCWFGCFGFWFSLLGVVR